MIPARRDRVVYLAARNCGDDNDDGHEEANLDAQADIAALALVRVLDLTRHDVREAIASAEISAAGLFDSELATDYV